MKSPLRYQATEYDCGPTTMLNAILYLFEREEIPPDLVRHIGLCTLDSYDREGHCGMYGTSGAAIRYFGTWLNELRHGGLLPVRSEFLEGADVHLKEGGRIRQALKCGDAVVVHVWQKEVGHYILLTGLQKDTVCAFDPYFQYQGAADYAVDPPDPFACNVCIPLEILDSFNRYTYAMGETDTREALVIGREAVEMLYII